MNQADAFGPVASKCRQLQFRLLLLIKYIQFQFLSIYKSCFEKKYMIHSFID
jgi:hypothetical protein